MYVFILGFNYYYFFLLLSPLTLLLSTLFQMHLDPFEEIKMAEESADQHRRSASEKEVRISSN